MKGSHYWLQPEAQPPGSANPRALPGGRPALARPGEFPANASEWPSSLDRRDFLKSLGATLALAGATSCTRQPMERIIPYVHQPPELTPGEPLFFATAMSWHGSATGLLVESHEGHPTKIEGNPRHPMSLGATNVFHQASLLDLYDPDRSKSAREHGAVSNWGNFVAALRAVAQEQRARHGAGIRILTGAVNSPTLQAQIGRMLAEFPGARWHQHESISRESVAAGARLAFGRELEVQHRFDRARVVVSLDSDFLFAHPAALRHTHDFAGRRRPSSGATDLNRFYAIEPTPSVTGANADHRLPLAHAQVGSFAQALARKLAVIPGGFVPTGSPIWDQWIQVIAQDLEANRGAGMVVAGEQQPAVVHALVHAINHHVANTGSTLYYTSAGLPDGLAPAGSLASLVEDMAAGRVEVLVMLGGNPVYSAPADLEFERHLPRVPFSAHLSPFVDETSSLCQWHVPEAHYLESWGDAAALDGTVSLVQPLIIPLHGGRSAHEILDALVQPGFVRDDYAIVREHWLKQGRWPDYEAGWRSALRAGLIEGTAHAAEEVQLRAFDTAPAAVTVPNSLEVVFKPDASVWDGRFANNGWLQELPRPLSKLTWNNPALISPALAQSTGLSNGDKIALGPPGRRLELPVWITPGQAAGSITLSLGYGRGKSGRTGTGVGYNVNSLRDSGQPWALAGVNLTKSGDKEALAATQLHHVIDSDERQIYFESTLSAFATKSSPQPGHATRPGPADAGYQWGMMVDLTTCTGCNACVVACQAENNIPVVGRDQVARGWAMHWLRIDTYYSGGADNPRIHHQPVACMHCENAPCELVCPVAATVHDHEGLNVQVYNRCIGTRYCSNNCPYKVRRFNFLEYNGHPAPVQKLLHNPNVTVRSRGVMEKCTYCVQRISAARIRARCEGRVIRDGEVRTACQQACPAEAIVFGDISDPASRVSKLKAGLSRAMLEDLNTRPRTTYLPKARNPNPALEPTHPPPSTGATHA